MYLTSEDVQLARLSKITLPHTVWSPYRGVTPLWFPFFKRRKPAGHYLSKRGRFLQCLFQIVVWGTLVLHVPTMERIHHKIWVNPPSFSVFGLQLSYILLLLSLCKVTPIEDQLQGDLHSSKPSNSNCDGPAWVWWSAGVWVVPPALPVLLRPGADWILGLRCVSPRGQATSLKASSLSFHSWFSAFAAHPLFSFVLKIMLC